MAEQCNNILIESTIYLLKYGKHRNWTFIDGCWYGNSFCHSSDRNLFGKSLIWAVNKYAPEEEGTKKVAKVAAAVKAPTNALSSQETAVIVSAVSMATQGLGKVVKIEKL